MIKKLIRCSVLITCKSVVFDYVVCPISKYSI